MGFLLSLLAFWRRILFAAHDKPMTAARRIRHVIIVSHALPTVRRTQAEALSGAAAIH